MSYVPESVKRGLRNGKYLPKKLRDFHDQKDLFKAIHGTFEQSPGHEVNWIDGHVYTVDVFLWVMAAHGYTLQKSRGVSAPTLDLDAFVQGYRDEQNRRFAEFLMSERNDEQSNSSKS